MIEKGAQIVVPMCDADFGAPGRTGGEREGHPRDHLRRRAGHRQADDRPAHVQHLHGLADGERDQRRVRLPRRWAGARAYFLCDQLLEYTKVVCEAFKTRWKELGGDVAGEDTFLQSDVSIASQVTRLQNAPKPDFVVLASFPGGSPAIKEIRAAYDGPIVLSAAYSGTFWLKATPHLSNVWVAAVGSSYGDDPRARRECVLPEVQEQDRRGRGRSTPIRSSATHSSRRSRRASRSPGRPRRRRSAKALETFKDEPLLAGPDDLHGELPRPGQPLAC